MNLKLTDEEKDVHTEHCCARHGCKYGDEDCTVENREKPQSHPCERCHEESGAGTVVIVQEKIRGKWQTAVHRFEMRPGIYRNEELIFEGPAAYMNALAAAQEHGEKYEPMPVRIIEVTTIYLDVINPDLPEA